MQTKRPNVTAATFPLPTRAAPVTLISVMALTLCAAVVTSQIVAVVSSL